MRKSVRQSDIGYDPQAQKYIIYFNGEKINNCFTADEEIGEVHVYKKYQDGEFVLNHDNTIIEEETLYGDVKIVESD